MEKSDKLTIERGVKGGYEYIDLRYGDEMYCQMQNAHDLSNKLTGANWAYGPALFTKSKTVTCKYGVQSISFEDEGMDWQHDTPAELQIKLSARLERVRTWVAKCDHSETFNLVV